MRPAARPGSACRPPSGRSRPSAGCWSATGRCRRSSTSATSATSTSPSSCPTASSRRSPRPSRWPTCSTASPRSSASTAPRWCSSTPAGWPSGWPTSWRAAGRRRGRRPPRQPVQGAPPPGRDPAAGRRPQGAGRHRVARARHRHRAGRAGVPDRLAPQHRHLPPAGRPVEPQPGGHAQGPPVPPHPRRAGRVHGPAGRGAGRPPRHHPPGPAPARHRRPAGRGRGRRPRSGRTDELYDLVRRAAPYTSLDRAEFDEVVDLVADGIETGRGRRGAYLHHDTVNGELRARKGARLAAVTSGRRHPRDRRLPGGGRARRHLHRHGQRGLGRRVDGRRHLPARHPLVADPPGRGRRGAGPRRRRHAADHPVLAGRGAGPHRRAVRGGVRAAAPGRRAPGRRRSRRRPAVAGRRRRDRRARRPR